MFQQCHDICIPPRPSFETHKGATKEQGTTLKLIELLGLRSLNGSFSQTENKINLLSPFTSSPFCKGERKSRLKVAMWCNYVSCWCRWFNLSLALRLNTCVSWFSALLTSLTLHSHSTHPTRHHGKTDTTRGACVLLRDSFIHHSYDDSAVRSCLSAPRHQLVRLWVMSSSNQQDWGWQKPFTWVCQCKALKER